MLTFILTFITSTTAQAKDSSYSPATQPQGIYESPNVISNGMTMAADKIVQATESTVRLVNESANAAASATTNASKRIVSGAHTGVTATAHGVRVGAVATVRGTRTVGVAAARGVGNEFAFRFRTVGSGAAFVFHVPVMLAGTVTNTRAINNFIRPADHVDVPIIDPNSPELAAALAALPAKSETTQANTKIISNPIWPIHGAVTTLFGVPHWPYQSVHTGLDISDGQRSGVTPIHPFRAGRVVDAIVETGGLGKHVIIDHGNGVTSVYGHLYSISVHAGQEVTSDDVLGTEGSTGVSTGTHLHFEIRVNGQATDPHQFISGQP